MPEEIDAGFALAVHNPLLGVFNYIVLSLPSGWRVKTGDFPPDLHSSIKVEDVRWVREGTSTSYLYHDQDALRLLVNVRQKQRNENLDSKNITPIETRSVYVNGHEAKTLIGKIARGLLTKKTFEYLRMIVYCDVTKRNIDLTMEGRCDEKTLRAVVDKLQLSKCH